MAPWFGPKAMTGLCQAILSANSPHVIDETRSRQLPHLKLPEVDGPQGLQPNGRHSGRPHGQGRRDGWGPAPTSAK